MVYFEHIPQKGRIRFLQVGRIPNKKLLRFTTQKFDTVKQFKLYCFGISFVVHRKYKVKGTLNGYKCLQFFARSRK